MLVLHRLKSNSKTSKFFSEKREKGFIVALLYLILKLITTKCNQNMLNCSCDMVAVAETKNLDSFQCGTFYVYGALVSYYYCTKNQRYYNSRKNCWKMISGTLNMCASFSDIWYSIKSECLLSVNRL